MAFVNKYVDVHALVNDLYSELIGKKDIAQADASNIVSMGQELKDTIPGDKMYQKIVEKVGKTVVENHEWQLTMPKLYKDNYQMGLLLEALRVRTFEATTDPSVKPVSGTSYVDSLTKYNAADVVAKYYNTQCGFQLEYWRPNDQLWTAFNSWDMMEKFIGALVLAVSNSMKMRLLTLSKLCVSNMIAETIYNAFPDGEYEGKSSTRAVNLLHLYNAAHPDAELTAENCRLNSEFLRFACKTMDNYSSRMQEVSSKFNIDGEDEQTTAERLNVTLLSTFANDIKYHLYNAAGQFDFSLMKLPAYDTVAAWQATEEFDEGVISEVNVRIKDLADGSTHDVEATGIMGIMYDDDAMGINCERKKVTAFYHPDLDQTKFFDKFNACYINKTDKNFVVFYIA